MSELLAPAGNMEALIAAISNGADAIYLGMSKFGARAYASNFDFDTLKDAIKYAHLRNVRIYVTMNTIVFDHELMEAKLQIDELYKIGVDGIIIQDLALVKYITANYPLMEAHASTQMGLDDIYGVNFTKDLKMNRVVLGREVYFNEIKKIKEISNMPIEIFVHGALCVSYSGNCLMSGLIGYRSGNRGRCVGSCRKPYELINTTNNESLGTSYILSMKDLSTIEYTDDLKEIDSLKIEGRMKESIYVANIINSYRKALDNKENIDSLKFNLTKTFNRTFTKGYIFNEDIKDVINTKKPNHHGYYIGKIIKKMNTKYILELEQPLNQNDQIRIDSKEEVSYPVIKMYDLDLNLINSSSTKCILEIKENVNVGDNVYITKDKKFNEELERNLKKEFKRIPLNIIVNGKVGSKLTLVFEVNDIKVYIESDFILEESLKNPATENSIIKQLDRLNDTPYIINNVTYNISNNIFIPSSKLNELRRQGIIELDNKRLNLNRFINKIEIDYNPISYAEIKPKLSVYCETIDQYNACIDLEVENIYYKNLVKRNNAKYLDNITDVLVGGYNGINYYKNKNVTITSDFSLNVVNSSTVHTLHEMGVNRITLSHEITKASIDLLLDNYNKENNGYPNLEMIVYGHAHLLHTKYCPLKSFDMCKTLECKSNKFILKDDYSYFPIIKHEDCSTTLLNGKILNLIDDLNNINHINYYRIQLTIEDYNESFNIIKMFQDKLDNKLYEKKFDSDLHTRGHFNKEIL